SQKQSRLIKGLLSETVNHKLSAEGITFMGPDPKKADRTSHSVAPFGSSGFLICSSPVSPDSSMYTTKDTGMQARHLQGSRALLQKNRRPRYY
ncbi:hypothetical protein, partial [Nitrobacter vulgaris]|uniref:hypothetical protein n=1 Tax=Nitrobacter vulgaris TaxID=29421 RepID=UPI001AED007D